MEKFPKYFLSIFILVIYTNLQAQVNCNSIEGENCKKACEIFNHDSGSQGSQQSQENLDKAIVLCPSFSDAYMEKSVPYLKRGDFVTWKKLIDKAVELDPANQLGYRGWCKLQFLRDYEGAIEDFDQLEKYRPENLGYSKNGNYNLYVAKAICYSALNQKEKAIKILENLFKTKNYNFGLYDYYQLGVTYFELTQYDKALENFEKQSKIYDFAENIYFKSKVAKIRNKDYLDLKNLALNTYDEGKYMKDAYTHHFNKVYRTQIAEL
ncbi:Tfp pilus assembly protein PilF [Kaistella chaponensis]|uniref:Tfp pilus assembly protein PilF n=1 Tax=Kaistella chaponensis TaxID=713588 RepID=A0A1N7KXZ5_9FLAO|nr:tetratricopeptide repeat protein [Kaistella chaponensis]SIS66489.1 Tfp pilus assembly protein PilF [Kaistella chaponensis]